MSGARRGRNEGIDVHQSDITPVGDTITLDNLNPVRPHCFAGLQFFADASGETPATPGAGTVQVNVRTINTTPNFEPTPVGTINAAAPETLSWAANTISVRATPTGITTATHYRLVVTCNEA